MEGPMVQLFVTCLVDSLAPAVGRSTVDMLEKAGCRGGVPLRPGVLWPQPAFNCSISVSTDRDISTW